MHCHDLELLRRKYANAQTKEDLYIKNTLENIIAQFSIASQEQSYYANVVAQDFCRIIKILEAHHQADLVALARRPQGASSRFQSGDHLMRAFYNHYKTPDQVDYIKLYQAQDQGRKDLINPTMKDYVARIYTFSGPRYLGEMVSPQELAGGDPILFVFDNIERLLATFKTRDEAGQIVKQRVNLRSALRKLNDFKQQQKEK